MDPSALSSSSPKMYLYTNCCSLYLELWFVIGPICVVPVVQDPWNSSASKRVYHPSQGHYMQKPTTVISHTIPIYSVVFRAVRSGRSKDWIWDLIWCLSNKLGEPESLCRRHEIVLSLAHSREVKISERVKLSWVVTEYILPESRWGCSSCTGCKVLLGERTGEG